MHMAFLTAMTVVVVLHDAAPSRIEIPCNTNQSVVFTVQSNRDYSLTNCEPPAGTDAGVSIVPDVTNVVDGVVALKNMSLTVVGGGVLPLIAMPITLANASCNVENVIISIGGARIGPYHYNYTGVRSLVSIFCVSCATLVTRNVTLVLNDTVVDIRSTGAVAGKTQTEGLLMLAAFFADVSDVAVRVVGASNVSIVIECANSISFDVAMVSIESINSWTTPEAATSIISKIAVDIVDSTVSIAVNTSSLVADSVRNPVLFSLRCFGPLRCVATNVSIGVVGSSVSVVLFTEAFSANSSGLFPTYAAVSVVRFDLFAELTNAYVSIDKSSVRCGCFCSSACDTPAGGSGLNAAVVWLAGVGTSEVRGFQMVVKNVAATIQSTTKSYFLAITYCSAAVNVNMSVLSSSVALKSAGQNIGSQARISALVTAYNMILPVTRWTFVAIDTSVDTEGESGGCFAVITAVVLLSSNVDFTTLNITNVLLTSALVNGTVEISSALGLSFALTTLVTGFLVLQPQSAPVGGNCSNALITVTNSALVAEHSTSLPTGATNLALASLVCAASVTISLQNTTIIFRNVHIERRFSAQHPSSSGIPVAFTGYIANVTVLVQFSDMSQWAPPSFAPIVIAIQKGAAALIAHSNVTVLMTDNCTVAYSTDVAQLPTDQVGFLALPSIVHRSTYIFNSSHTPQEQQKNVFSLVGTGSDAIMVDVIVHVTDVIYSVASLIAVSNGATLTLRGNSTILFSKVTLTMGSTTAAIISSTLRSTINVVEGGIISFPDPSSTIAVRQCHFRGYTTLIAENALSFTEHRQDDRLSPLLLLGCNLWDDTPLRLSSVSTNASILALVSYPPSAFNSTVKCAGITQSITATLDAPLPVLLPSSFDPSFLLPSGATTSGAVAVYAAVLVPVAQARSVAGLQRAIAALRLAARCAVSTANATYADPMYSQLVDNPLGLPVAVGADTLQYAAGAAVGNALLVLAIAALMHCLQLAKCKAAGHTKMISAVVSYLPSSLLPGSAAMPFGKLVQPAVGACVALMVSSDRTVRSVVCGAVMLSIWVAYPVYCCAMVFVRGRSAATFVLRSENVRHTKTSIKSFRWVIDFATEPTHEWVTARGAGEHARFLSRRMLPVFEAYVGRREWYFAVEWGFAMVSGAVLGAAEAVASGGDACLAAKWGVGCAVGLSAVQLLMCLWLRPFAVRLELWMALLLGGLELVSNSLSLTDKTAAADVVVSVSAYLELVIGVLVPLIVFVMMQVRRVVAPPGGADRRYFEQITQLRALVEIICRERQL